MSAVRDTQLSPLPAARQAGVCLHVTSLPGAYGIGEIGASARRFVDLMSALHLNVWQFLPTGPTAYADSPYQPLSSFAGNEMLIDIDELVQAGLLHANETQALRALPHDTVDYGALIPAKHALLARAAARFDEQPPPELHAAFEEFLHRCDGTWLHDYAVFRLLKTRHGERPWPEWYPAFVHRERAALARLEAGSAKEIRAIKFVQFLFDRQWHELRRYANSRGIWLFGDMPICIALDSADAWGNPEMLLIDRDGNPDHVAGVPPDYFSEDGQLWGNPLYDWTHHDETGYAWWIARLRHSAMLADVVRIDHFRGFESYWSIPADEPTARNGSWEPGPGDAIFDAMRNALGQLPIIAEDLGVITPEVEALRLRHRIPGMRVLQFDVGDDTKVIEEDSVCYTGTHDNDTTVGWFRGSSDDTRTPAEIRAMQKRVLAATGGTPETIHTDLIRHAFGSPARLAIAPMQDYLGLGSEARLNTPGTSRNNWRWRLTDEHITPALCDQVRTMTAESGRGT